MPSSTPCGPCTNGRFGGALGTSSLIHSTVIMESLRSDETPVIIRAHFVTTQKRALFLKNGVFWDITPCGSCKNRLGTSSQCASVCE
jgi:hypothetical protein